MPARKPIAIGTRFTRLVVIGEAPPGTFKTKFGYPRYKVFCRCDCGATITVPEADLRDNNTRSCGCYKNELTGKRFRTHGLAGTREHKIWGKMLQRCLNPKCTHYEYYGGRGITVCSRWKSFEAFLEDMGNAPSGYELERKDNNKGYCKENCKWATRKEQMSNIRRNRNYVVNGTTMNLSAIGRLYKVDRRAIDWFLRKGLPIDAAIAKALGGRGTRGGITHSLLGFLDDAPK